jgi:hypothetical protein
MFSKISRYKKLTGIVTTDSRGRSLESKRIRLLPEVSGTFLHTVEENDRPDHLAYKYYKQPLKWWRICDANPEFMSPLALLGRETIVTTRFPVTFNSNDTTDQPPWYEIIKRLSLIPGVQDVSIEENSLLVKKTDKCEGQQVVVNTEQFKRVLIVTHNHLNVTAADLKNAIEKEDEHGNKKFIVGEPTNIGRIGKKIIIPSDVVG